MEVGEGGRPVDPTAGTGRRHSGAHTLNGVEVTHFYVPETLADCVWRLMPVTNAPEA